MKFYIDADFRCHATNPDNSFREFEDKFFDGKCATFIEGFVYIPDGEFWTRSNGMIFEGKIITPWKSYEELDSTQREYERQLLAEYEAENMELREHSIPTAELEAAYREGVNSV